MSTLFREEVITRRARAIFGDVVVHSSPFAAVLAAVAVVLASGVVVVLVVGTYAPKERVQGYLAPSAGELRIVAPRDGVVTSVHAAEGRTVRAGDPLVVIGSPVEAGASGNVDAVQVDALVRERAALEAQVARERALARSAADGVAARIEGLDRRTVSAAGQRGLVAQRIELLEHDVARLRTLQQRGHLAASMLDARLIDLLGAREQLQALDQEAARMAEEIAAFELERSQISMRLEVRIGDLKTRLLSIERELAAAEARWSLVVRAPVDGMVAALTTQRAMTVTAGRPLLTIVPSGSRMRAELLVPTRAAGFVERGQAVRLRYDAYPYQKFGLHRATIAAVSHTVLPPHEQPGPFTAQGPVYRVIAELDRQSVDAYDAEIPLQSGMTLQADILRDRRRIIEWLFDPVLAAARGV